MYQQPLFLCTTCGGDQLRNPHEHRGQSIELYRCPICGKFALTTEDPNQAEWVALGQVVCGYACHVEAYNLERQTQPMLPLHPP